MEKNKFNELIAKYWDGTSSLEEEDQLRSYLRTSEGSSKYPEQAAMFGFFKQQKELGTNITEFPVERLKVQESAGLKEEPKVRKLVSISYVRNIAAALLIVLGAYFVWNNKVDPPKTISNYVEVEDPKEALEITKKALALLSNKVDKSERLLKQNIAKLSVNNILK